MLLKIIYCPTSIYSWIQSVYIEIVENFHRWNEDWLKMFTSWWMNMILPAHTHAFWVQSPFYSSDVCAVAWRRLRHLRVPGKLTVCLLGDPYSASRFFGGSWCFSVPVWILVSYVSCISSSYIVHSSYNCSTTFRFLLWCAVKKDGVSEVPPKSNFWFNSLFLDVVNGSACRIPPGHLDAFILNCSNLKKLCVHEVSPR